MKNLFPAPICLAAALALALAGCSSGGSGGASRAFGGRPDRPPLPPVSEPGAVAASDIAFAKAAREEGQWAAFSRFAANGAVLHGANGPIAAAPWLAQQDEPEQAVSWSPTTVWSSCDGSLAVSFGRFQQPDGLIGSYVTTWELQSSGEYRWSYDMGSIDDPQPPPRQADVEVAVTETMIVVPGIDAIEGLTADCLQRGVATPAPPAFAMPQGAEGASFLARDGSLRWRYEHHADGTRRAVIDYLRLGDWREAIDFTVLPAGE